MREEKGVIIAAAGHEGEATDLWVNWSASLGGSFVVVKATLPSSDQKFIGLIACKKF